MNTIAFIVAGGLIVLVILSKIPGLEHLVRPLIDIVFSLLKVMAENAFSWTIWLFKALLSSHVELARNLVLDKDQIDPSQKVRRAEK